MGRAELSRVEGVVREVVPWIGGEAICRIDGLSIAGVAVPADGRWPVAAAAAAAAGIEPGRRVVIRTTIEVVEDLTYAVAEPPPMGQQRATDDDGPDDDDDEDCDEEDVDDLDIMGDDDEEESPFIDDAKGAGAGRRDWMQKLESLRLEPRPAAEPEPKRIKFREFL
jgi:hypothetical protein